MSFVFQHVPTLFNLFVATLNRQVFIYFYLVSYIVSYGTIQILFLVPLRNHDFRSQAFEAQDFDVKITEFKRMKFVWLVKKHSDNFYLFSI